MWEVVAVYIVVTHSVARLKGRVNFAHGSNAALAPTRIRDSVLYANSDAGIPAPITGTNETREIGASNAIRRFDGNFIFNETFRIRLHPSFYLSSRAMRCVLAG